MLFIYKAQDECLYYHTGVGLCRDKVFEKFENAGANADEIDYSRCKEVLDAYYNCTTFNQYGKTIDDIEPEAKPFLKNYAKCLFYENEGKFTCRKYFDDVLRYYYRKNDSPLKKI